MKNLFRLLSSLIVWSFSLNVNAQIIGAVDIKVFLGGPYNEVTGEMKDDIRFNGDIPVIAPPEYGLGAIVSSFIFPDEGSNSIVDWVVMEARSQANPEIVAEAKLAFVEKDGDLVALDGFSDTYFSVPYGNYYISVRHRNHLRVMTQLPITLSGDTTIINFTDPSTQTFGTDAQKNISGVNVMWPGDVNGDGEVKYTGLGNDRDLIFFDIGGVVATNIIVGYHSSDVNMDGLVKYTGSVNDRDIILQVIGGNVPTNIIVEQIP